jgi:hypothetical protein
LVEELTALWIWHMALETDAATDGAGAVSWHTALWRFTDRSLAPITRRCISTHEEPSDDVAHARRDTIEGMRVTYNQRLATAIERRRTMER